MHKTLKYLVGGLAALAMALPAAAEQNPQAVKDLLDRIGGSGTSQKMVTELNPSLAQNGRETFVITSSGGKPCVKGSSLSAVTTGINWYLNHTARQNLTWNRPTTTLSSLPAPSATETHSSSADFRYYLNYCTFSYSMSTWTWERWEQEIDYMALHGINMPLQIVGLDVVWRNLLTKDFGYSADEADAFIAGPCFQAWWGMNNLEGWGGKNPDWWYERQEQLAKKIVARMRELGIEPVLPGFCGMVPHDFTAKTGMSAITQGGWCGFTRPYILNPETDAFKQVAEKYYARLAEVMGTSQYYSMDPFHEGANTSGIANIGNAYKQIYEAMERARSGAQWVIQSWQWSGAQYSVLDNVPVGRLIVLDLFSDGNPHLSSYKNHHVIYCALPNFGGRTGLFGRFNGIINGYFDQKANIKTITGIGATPEAIEQVPVLYDALFELPWHSTKPDPKQWMEQYAVARYGTASQAATRAWELLRNSALNCTSGLQGPHEAVMCARPAWTVNSVSTWGGSTIFYEPADVATAAYELLEANLSGENYSYDLTDVTRQALTDYSYYLLKAINDARTSDAKAFAARKETFLQLMTDLDALLATNSNFMLGRWTNMARGIADEVSGTTDADRDWLELNNARTLISTWGQQANSEGGGLRDYSYRQWSGMLKDYYRNRWDMFFKGNGVNWFSHDWAWAHNKKYTYSDKPVGDTRTVASELLERYLPRLGSRFIYRSMDNDLTDAEPTVVYRGEKPELPLDGFTVVAGTASFTLPEALPADAPLGDCIASAVDGNGTTVTFRLSIRDRVTKPRTVSVNFNAAHGSASINGTDGKEITTADAGVTISAKPNAGFSFSHWSEDGKTVSYDNPYTYYGAQSAAFTANFVDANVIRIGNDTFLYDETANGAIIIKGYNSGDGIIDLSLSEKPVVALAENALKGSDITTLTLPSECVSLSGLLMCESLNGNGTQDVKFTPSAPVKQGSSWAMVLKVKTNGSSFNQWGSGLIATGPGSLEATYDGGLQVYLAKAGTITIKTGSAEHRDLSANVGSAFTLAAIYDADARSLTFRLITAAGTTQSFTIGNYSMNTVSEFSSSIPAGIDIESLCVFPFSTGCLTAFGGCTALKEINVAKGNPMFSSNDKHYLLSADGTALLALPEGLLFSAPFRLINADGGEIYAAPEADAQGQMTGSNRSLRVATRGNEPFASLWSLKAEGADACTLRHLNSGNSVSAKTNADKVLEIALDKSAVGTFDYRISADGTDPKLSLKLHGSDTWIDATGSLSKSETAFGIEPVTELDLDGEVNPVSVPFACVAPYNTYAVTAINGELLQTRRLRAINADGSGAMVLGPATITFDSETTADATDNFLSGTTLARTGLASGSFFLFDPATRKFVRSKGTTVPANSVYIKQSAFGNPIAAESLTIDIFDPEAIGEVPVSSDSTVTYFDLQGRHADHGLLIGTDGSKTIR